MYTFFYTEIFFVFKRTIEIEIGIIVCGKILEVLIILAAETKLRVPQRRKCVNFLTKWTKRTKRRKA